MAKKKIEEPAYVKAPLRITREEFTKLLSKQIEKGSELLKMEVQQLPTRGNYMGASMYGFGGSRPDDSVKYEETSKQAFMAAYKMWDDFNKEITNRHSRLLTIPTSTTMNPRVLTTSIRTI